MGKKHPGGVFVLRYLFRSNGDVTFRPGQSAFALLLCRRFEKPSWRIAMFSQLRKHDFKEFKPFQSLSPLNALSGILQERFPCGSPNPPAAGRVISDTVAKPVSLETGEESTFGYFRP
jgi:hypothetical protein